MTPNLRWWSQRSGLSRLDVVSRWQLYLLSGSEPLVVYLFLAGDHRSVGSPATLGMLAVAGLHTFVCVCLLRAGLDGVLKDARPRPRLIALAVAVTGLAGLAAVLLISRSPAASNTETSTAFLVTVVLFSGLTGALATLFPAGPLALGVAVPAGLVGVLAGNPMWASTYLLTVGTVAVTYRWTVWYLRVAWEIERSRQVREQLAVAEERLRFSRDLHDVLGRNLTLIALESEIAVRLTRGGQEGAVERMLKVHTTAQESMREIREVVSGYRRQNLEAELAGARSLLRSAGIDARVIGSAANLPNDAQAALGWVVREAVTNIIRHSDAAVVTLDLGVHPDVAVLVIENDGVPVEIPPSAVPRSVEAGAGAGLAGLRERLTSLGGQVSAGRQPGERFRVEARLPLTARAAVEVAR